ncbi:radical SAM protein [Fusobacterium varium]
MDKLINRYGYYNKFVNFVTFIKVDENCNLKCEFCYQKDKKNNRIDTEEKLNNCLRNLDVGITKFLKIIENEDFEYSQLCICFFGGEPTLNPWAINKICDHIIKNYSIKDRNKLAFTYTSNGLIFNNAIKDTLKKMKSVNKNQVGVMISCDNDKEVFDRNRKLIGSNKSGYEIVQENIKKYKKFLFDEINKGPYKKDVKISTVLATSEQILNNPMLIQDKYKDIIRTGKFLYATENIDNNYIEASKAFLNKAYIGLINQCTKENKESSIDEVMENIFELNDKNIAFTECQNMYTIDGNGDVNWCNKVKNFEDEVLSQDKMREYIFNKEVDNSHFRCVKEKLANGELTKNKLQSHIWEVLISKFDPNVPVSKMNINKYFTDEKAIYDFIKYILGSTNYRNKEIYISDPSEKIINLCKEFNIKIAKQPIKSNVENTFYVDQKGNLFFDEIFKDDKDMILTNLKEKHFMWIHTPTLLNSVNKYFLKKLSY